jgi:hypothetical protein
MKAITVEPHKPQTARLEDIAEPVEPEYVVKIDPSLGMLGVLLEPTEGRHEGVCHGGSFLDAPARGDSSERNRWADAGVRRLGDFAPRRKWKDAPGV